MTRLDDLDEMTLSLAIQDSVRYLKSKAIPFSRDSRLSTVDIIQTIITKKEKLLRTEYFR